jgi:excisionase family DNA binding protein
MQDAQHDAMQHAQQTETWATLAEAASLLGCSVDTVRRRIRRGELHAMQDAGRHGPTWRVLLGVPAGTPSVVPTVGSMPSVNGSTPGPTPNTGDDNAGLLEALRMLDAMRQENRDLAGQVGYLQARVQLHEETIRALRAPAAPEASHTQQDANPGLVAPVPTTGCPGAAPGPPARPGAVAAARGDPAAGGRGRGAGGEMSGWKRSGVELLIILDGGIAAVVLVVVVIGAGRG